MTEEPSAVRRLVVVSAGIGQPSSTRLLANRLAAATEARLRDRGLEPTTEVIEMMRPQRFFIIGRSTARARRKVAVRFTRRTSSHSSSFIRIKRLSRVMPALEMRMSSPPMRPSAVFGSSST